MFRRIMTETFSAWLGAVVPRKQKAGGLGCGEVPLLSCSAVKLQDINVSGRRPSPGGRLSRGRRPPVLGSLAASEEHWACSICLSVVVGTKRENQLQRKGSYMDGGFLIFKVEGKNEGNEKKKKPGDTQKIQNEKVETQPIM